MTTRIAVLLDQFRELQSAALAGNSTFKKAAFMGFGDGGHTVNNLPKPIDSTRTTLFNQLIVKPLTALVQPTLTITRARSMVEGGEVALVSEAILYDEDMRPIAMATFPPKYTSTGETYEVTLQVKF